jgi:CheY-like chemotaxis protein
MSIPKRILVIDDEDDIREIAQIGLEMVAHWQVQAANSGEEGITKAKAERPDAILLDVMMPDMDGPTTFQKLRADPETSQIPVIFLTAKVQSADRRQFTDLGVKSVIAKPFDPLTLAEEVARILGWQS